MKRSIIRKRVISLILAVALCMCQAGMSASARPHKTKKIDTYTVTAPNGSTRTYLQYKQYRNYYNGRYTNTGAKLYCVLTAVAIAASGFGVCHKPQEILDADASVPFGERYALQKLHLMYHPRQVHTLYLGAQILRDMGIPARHVPTDDINAAEQQITAHLASGKPVIILAKKSSYRRIRIAHWRHALVLVKLNGNNTVTYINPNASVNGSAGRGKKKHIHLTVRELLDHYMFSSSGEWAKAYNPDTCGGYILVG